MNAATQPVPDDQTLYLHGLMALRGGALDEAAWLLTRALRRQPGHPGMRRNLVRALLLAERYEQVLLHANTALDTCPDDPEMHFARGTALNALGQPSRACAALARALALQPNHAAAWLNMGNAATDKDDYASAEAMYRSALRFAPELAEAWASLGYLLTEQGRLGEAVAACEEAIRLRPDMAQAHWNLAVALLLQGDLRRGLAEYEWRKRHRRFHRDFPDLPGRRWDGGDINGQTVLVRAEQGLGDTIQFARYLPMIAARGGRPVLVCAPELVPLLQGLPGVEVAAKRGMLPAYDAWVDQGSLPGLLGTTLETVPSAGGYLTADTERVKTWDAKLPKGRRIGLVLAGNPRHARDRKRSVPFEMGSGLRDVPDVVWVRFRQETAGPMVEVTGPRVMAGDETAIAYPLPDFAETAALVSCLDLVISVDTAVAHLAGALGKPVWLLLPHAPDWRWLLDRDDSPWYGSARLFRQTTPGDWHGVLQRIRSSV